MAPKLIMWNLESLDGYFAGPGGDLGFMQFAWNPQLEAFINDQAKSFGTIVFGRRTYEGMAEFWSDKTDLVGQIMNETPKVVFSRSLPNATWRNTRIARGDLRAEVAKLKSESRGDAFVLGSADLCSALLKEGLFDELRIGLVSILMGSGAPLFGELTSRAELTLLESRPLGDRIVLLRFAPKRPS